MCKRPMTRSPCSLPLERHLQSGQKEGSTEHTLGQQVTNPVAREANVPPDHLQSRSNISVPNSDARVVSPWGVGLVWIFGSFFWVFLGVA